MTFTKMFEGEKDIKVVTLSSMPSDAPFEVGSTVSLKGGGAVMTVAKPGKQGVVCEWHNTSDDPISATYHPGMLRHADPNEEKAANGDG